LHITTLALALKKNLLSAIELRGRRDGHGNEEGFIRSATKASET
jgi:hypothetical protein